MSTLISCSTFAQTPIQNQPKIVFQNNQAQFQIKSKIHAMIILFKFINHLSPRPNMAIQYFYILDGNATFPSAANIAQSIGAGSTKWTRSTHDRSGWLPSAKTFDVQKRAYDYTPKPSAQFQAQGKYKYGGADQFIAF